MSDLLMILVGLGVLIVVGVLLFNWWQERAFHQRVDQNFKPSKRDVLIEDFQVNTENMRQERAKSAQKTRIEPRVEPRIEPGLARDPDELNPERINPEQVIANERQYDALRKPTAEELSRAETLSEPLLSEFSHATRPDEVRDAEADEALTLQQQPLPDDALAAFADTDMDLALSETTPSTPAHVIEEVSLPSAMHPQIDVIALLYASSPLPLSQIKHISSQLKEFAEHTFAFGLNEAEDWVELSQGNPQATYSQLACALQLADRGGAVSRSILNRFQHMIETIGLDLSAHVEWQGNGDPLNQAVTLDQFCIEVDKTVGFHLLANDGVTFHATKLRGLLESQGLSLGADGRFHLMNAEHGGLEFSIKNFEGNPFSAEMVKSSVMHGITFQLDIPTVKNSAQVFDSMVGIAKALAKALDANMMDDNRRPLGDIQLEKIRQQLKVINAKMIAIGIIPGSQHALRLFS
ncbi:MAG TPA: cell division protein ZipA C-terminal FtsZ-binding domain-containing protein [Methylophilus sp.]